ncbi:pyruvate kinase [Actinomyces sp. zg-332]|uniref:pyruvate kinase n=1 Tax=Actinomyces sp. zg-332 TaxID=2708340 RepID=UPI0014227932|nr:pyruvate kinase [Actinomyces sp. zg-332]QPK94551.1 pyruvate kinase [Actinomyces sp. zg-332]
MRKSKIVCTLGPATSTLEHIQALVDAGMDVARINRSHGSAAEQEAMIKNVRTAARQCGKPVAILVDLQGPKIRLETFTDEKVWLEPGTSFTITTLDVEGNNQICGTTFKSLPEDCRVGDTILIDDGNVSLRVKNVTDTDVVCEVIIGGYVSDHKGINLPGVAVNVPALSEKDREDLAWAIDIGADFVALSFVRSADDIEDVHEIMTQKGVFLPVIAKIEKPQAVDKLQGIVETFDGIMVARGDLGVEMSLESVPMIQKRAIAIARQMAKPVIVATQVLDSMIHSPRPTRAEASDCANAILDGADGVMLSGETSVGKYPIESVSTMSRIIETTEQTEGVNIAELSAICQNQGGILARAATAIGNSLDARYLVTFTQSGDTANRLACLRTFIPMIALTPLESTRNKLALTWGMTSYIIEQADNTDDMVQVADEFLSSIGLVDRGDKIVILAGMPAGISGSINSVIIHTIGDTGYLSHK